jgi:N-acetylglucosamine-6-phosphate deacetylase
MNTVEHFQVANLFDGQQVSYFQFVTIENGIIQSISSKPMIDRTHYQPVDGWCVPGFIDVQVNGGGGVLFNQQPTVEGLMTIVDAHRQFGTVAMLPTLITDAYDVMEKGADAVAQAREQIQGIIGIHFEGPHLAHEKRGIHPEQHLRPLSENEIALYTRKDLGQVMVTVAPEVVSPQQIRQLVDENVIVCLGHSNAHGQTVAEALAAGARGFTHLYNAMSPLHSREPGMVGQALADTSSFVGLIVDFHHVHPTSCQLAINAKGADKVVLVTDGMAHVGSDEKVLPYLDEQIYQDDGKLTLKDGTLAGSSLDMANAVRNCLEQLNVAPKEAFAMASSTPAALLGLQESYGLIRVGLPANLVMLNSQMQVQRVWVYR